MSGPDLVETERALDKRGLDAAVQAALLSRNCDVYSSRTTLGLAIAAYLHETGLSLAELSTLRSRCETLEREKGAAIASCRVAEADAELWQIQVDKANAARDEAVAALDKVKKALILTPMAARVTELPDFMAALSEWGCTDPNEQAAAITDFLNSLVGLRDYLESGALQPSGKEMGDG